MWVFTLSPLFCNLLLPITLPKTVLQAMVKNPPKSFFKKTILVFNLASLISVHFLFPHWKISSNAEGCGKQSLNANKPRLYIPTTFPVLWMLMVERSSFRQVEHGTVGTLTSQFGSEIRLGKQSLQVGLVKLGYETRSFYLWKPWMERQGEAGVCVYVCVCVCVPICTCACSHFSLVYNRRSSQTCAFCTSSRPLLFNFRLGCHHP